MKHVLIIYVNTDSSAFNNLAKLTVLRQLRKNKISYTEVTLNYDFLTNIELSYEDEIVMYKRFIANSTDIIFIFSVQCFYSSSILDLFISKIFVEDFAFCFSGFTGVLGLPKPMLQDKHVLAIVNHTEPDAVIKLIYVIAVKSKFFLGFLCSCFSFFKSKTIHVWANNVSNEEQKRLLERVKRKVNGLIKK